MHFFTRNPRSDNAVCAGALSWWSLKDPIICNFHSNSHHPISQTVQDFEIIFLIQCETRWYKFFMNYPTRIEKKMTTVLIFDLLMTAFFCLGDCRKCHFSFCFLVSGSYSKNQISLPVMTQIRNLVQLWVIQAYLLTLHFNALFDCHSNFLEPSLHKLFSCSNLV
jgi:hypothetical protein